MPNAFDIKPAENLVVLAVGIPGCGKTSAITSWCSPETPGYNFDIDHRIRGLRGSSEWLGEDCLKSLDYDQYDTKDGFKGVEKQFMEFDSKYSDLPHRNQLKYKNLYIESVGSLSQMFLIDSQTQKGYGPGQDLSKLPEKVKKGARIVGNIAFPGPDDWNYGQRAFHTLFYHYFMNFSKCNIFLSAWTTDKWVQQKDTDGNVMPYADKVVSGKQILATNKIASELPGYFDEIWEFHKEETGNSSKPLKYTVTFRSALAKTAIPQLPNSVDITGKNFKKVFDELVAKGA